MSNPIVVDLSHWQAYPIDFKAMRAGGTQGVILKCTEGETYVDPTFGARGNAARAAGLHVASYHFLRPGSAARQMSWYIDRAAPAPGDRLVVDFEDEDCTLADLHAAVDALLARSGCRVAVYGASFLIDTVQGNYAPWLAATSLWAARYSSQEPELKNTWPRWDLWQYTDKAECAGVGSLVDGNRWNDEAGSLAAWFHGPAAPEGAVVYVTIEAPAGVVVRVNGITV